MDRSTDKTMRSLPETFTTVLAGAWNTHIFSPDWISANLLGGQEVDVELGFSPGQMLARFKWGGLVLIPQSRRLTAGVQQDCALWKDASGIAVQVLALLPHTPISAVGVNFGFITTVDRSEGLANALNSSDEPSLIRAGGTLAARQITRAVELNGRILNLKFNQGEDDQIKIHMNFHKEVDNAIAAREATASCIADDVYTQGVNFLRNAYGIEVENGD